MFGRLRRNAHPLLTLVLGVCCAFLLWRDSQRPGFPFKGDAPADHIPVGEDVFARNFLGAKWLGGDYLLPQDVAHCTVVVLRYEDGKFRERMGGTVFSPRPGGSRLVPFYVMWGPGPKGTRVVSGWPGMWSGSDNDERYTPLNGGVSRAFGSSRGFGELRGYRVYGFATSSVAREGREAQARTSSGDVGDAVVNHKHVLVLGMKPFPSEQAARDWLYTELELPAD
jgi:hypothetical protein